MFREHQISILESCVTEDWSNDPNLYMVLYCTFNCIVIYLKAWKCACFGRNVTCTSWRRAHHCRLSLQEKRGFSTTAQCRQSDAWSSKPISSTSRRLSEASVTFMMDRWHIHCKHIDIIFARRRLVQNAQVKLCFTWLEK